MTRRHRLGLATGAGNLSGAGQETQGIAARSGQDLVEGCRDRLAGRVAHGERIEGPGHVDHRAVAQKARYRRGVERRRHHKNAQVGPRHPRLAGEREAQIGVDAALVELVHDERGDVAQQRVVLQICGQDALGDDEQPGVSAGLPLEADVPAHLAAQRPAAFIGNATRHGPGRDPPRLQQEHAAPVHQRRWHARGLAGPRRRRQHGRPVAIQRQADRADEGIDGERRRGHVTYDGRP